jgi:hypothetical protein
LNNNNTTTQRIPKKNIMSNAGNGGIGGTGIFGMFGTTILCPVDDTSYYCTIMKYFQLMMIFFFVIFIMYLIYSFSTMYFGSGKSSRKSR